MAVTLPAPTPDQQLRPHNTDQDIATDGDVRYNAGIAGYDRDSRKRVRAAEHQVNLLVTARIRDQRTATSELHHETLVRAFEQIGVVIRLYNEGYAGPGDVRAEFVSLAATATICAEAVDRPHEIGGVRLLRAGGKEHLRVA